ncbi:rRNA maturation RNase YbeY [Candidatus Microgenomates bacterium]|nr:rRNA maturation RNase YbeY [Candidatus Microgenomates bacterium]
MISVLISSESRYPISRPKIRTIVEDYLRDLGIDDVEVSVAVVGSRKIKQLNKKWRNLDEPTTVLTFALEEPRNQDGVLRIGDIVISYPEARIIAQEDNLNMDSAIGKLLIHGLGNLFGKNDNNFLSQISPPKTF